MIDRPQVEWLDANIEYETEPTPSIAKVIPLTDATSGSGKRILYKRSSQSEDGKPKLPSNMEYGELAINYGDGIEVIAIKNSADEIITFIPLRAFLEAPIVDDADYLIGVDGNDIILYDYKVGTYRFVGSEEGDSVVVVDDEDITVPANETVEGTFHDISEIKTNNLKEVYIHGDATTKFCESSLPLNYTLETIYVSYSGSMTIDASNLCYNLHGLKTAQLINLKPSSLSACFRNCENLETLESGTWDLSECDSLDMFMCISSPYTNEKLKTFDTSKWDTSKVTSMRGMFQYCTGLEKLDVSNWDTSSVTTMYLMFGCCVSLEELDVSKWNTSNVTTMQQMFTCELDDNTFKSNLKQLDVSNWDTSKVTDMSGMFNACTSLEELDVSNWDVSNVTDMWAMFANCESLKYVDVSNWNTSNVTNMGYMFGVDDYYEPMVINNLDVSKWDTSNVTDMEDMFLRCKALESIDVSKWNVSKVTRTWGMFADCISLKEIDVSNWDTSSITQMPWMFGSDDDDNPMTIEKIDATNWNTSNITEIRYIFNNCKYLTTLKCGDNWNLESLVYTDDMFTNCESLRTVEGGVNNLMLDIDLSDCPLSRLSALVFINGFYDYSNGDTHTCKFSDYTLSTLLEEDFAMAAAKNWDIGSYTRSDDVVGDVVYWNSEQRRMIFVKPELVAEDNYPIELFTPLGILAIPSSHDVYGNGDAAMVSLALMDCNNPDSGQLSSNTSVRWGYNGLLVNVQNQTCVVTGTTESPTTAMTDISDISTQNHYLPSDSFDATVCPTDPKAYYSVSSSDLAVPSPYLEDGTPNPVYSAITQTRAEGDINMLSEFDGEGNTAFILDCVTTEGWQTADTISNTTVEGGNYPAAMCCWRYNPNGTQQGDWYLPSIGELGYMMARTSVINNSIDALNNAYGTIAHKIVTDYTWSSSEYNTSQAVHIDTSDGMVYPENKADSRDVRAFCHVDLLGYNYYFVGGDEDSIVTIDGENVTVPAGEEVYGYCYDDISDIPTNNLKEIHIYCDVSLRIGSETEIENYNTTVETVEIAFSGTFERDFTSLCRGLGALKSLKITGGVADSVDYMCNWCENLTELDVNGINTRRCVNLEDVFSNCKSLADIDLSKWDVSQVTDFRGIFYACPIADIDVKDWDTSKGENFWGVFDHCQKLTYLNLSGWDTSNAKTFRQLFLYCSALETLVLGDGWDCRGILSDSGNADDDNSFYNMFSSATALKNVEGSIRNIKANLDLSPCPLTRESALVFINGLSDEVSGHTLKLSSTTKGYLSDDDIAIATNKGWTIG